MKSIIHQLTIYGITLLSISVSAHANNNQSFTKSTTEISMTTTDSTDTNELYFIDKFFVPKNAIEEFTQRMNYNRNLIKYLEGFVKDEVYEHKDAEGNVNIITIAVWKNRDYMNKAKEVVQADYKKIGFDPITFTQKLNIKLERDLYTKKKD